MSDGSDPRRRWPRPSNDAERVAALCGLGVLDTPDDLDLAAVVRLASYVCKVPNAAVNLIDDDRQWQAVAHGFERGSVARDDSMCAWSILHPGVTYTRDASQDEVFVNNPFVDGTIASVRLYASAPVVISSGFVVGSLCVFSEQPGDLSQEQIDRLTDLAAAVARILELRKCLGEMTEAAASDSLTGLRNRAVFREELRRALGRYHDSVARVGVLFVDLNDFKPINDQYGHPVGDDVLKAIACRLGTNLCGSELVARVGGDEFAVLVQVGDGEDLAERMNAITARLAARLDEPVSISGGVTMLVGAAIGLATAQPDDTPESLLARADASMYAAKRASAHTVRDIGR